MTTQKLANFYENNELIDLYEIGNDYDEDDTNLGFNLPKRFTDFNNSFTNAEEFLALNDSLIERFPQFKTPLHDFLKTNNSERLGLAVNELLDPTKIDGDIYRQVSDDLSNNLSGFYQLPEEEQTKVRNVLASRNGLDGDSRWKTANDEDQNILTRPQPQISDDVLQYIGVANYVKTGDVSRKPRTRIRQDEIFKKLTGYSFEDITENRISKDIIESSQFQKGLTEFYNKNKDSIKIPDRSDTSTLTRQLQSFGYEVTGSIALGAVTSPMLAAGPPGIALFGITNFLGNYFINEKAQNIRKGQLAGVGEEGKTSFGEKFAAGITGMIPFGPGATGLRGIRNAALQGAATTGVETTIRTGIEEQRPPSLEETLTALSVGTIFGGTFKGSLDLFSKYVNKFQGLSGPEIDAQLTAKDKKNITKIVKDLEKIKKTQTEKIEQSVKRIDNLVDGKPKTTDTKKIPQINPEQVGDGDFTNARVESLINEGKISSSIKSRTETFEEAVELKNSPGFRKYISQLAKYRKENPSDRDILAAALEITDINTGIQDVNQKLINALNVKNDVNAVEQLGEDLIKSFGNLNDFLADAIPIRTDQARGLSIMGMSTEGLGSVTPEKWKAMTEPQKREFIRLQSGDIGINVDVANKDLETLSTSIRDAIKIYKDTGDPKTLNKLVNSIKRTNGNYNKVNKLVKYGIFANIANYDILDRPLRVINEVWLSAILYGPDTHVVNSLSSALELVAGNIELYLDPVNLTNPRELEVAIKHTWNLFTGFDFALKGAKESFNLESNYFTGMSKLDDFKDRIAFSMDGDNAISEAVNYFGKHVIRLPYKALTSEDAFFQGLSINASAYSGATLQGIRKGLKGQALKDYVNEQAELVIETFAKRIGKIINSKDPNTKEDAIQLYEMVKDFAKRSTFSEDLTSGGQLSTVTKWLAEGSAKSPIVRRFIPFVRILKNLIGRQTQRTLFLGQTPYLSGFYNDYVNGSPLLQKQLRGRVIFSAAIGSFIWSQMEKYADPNNDVHITGGGPSNREAFGRKWRTGWRPYSLGYVQKNEDGSTKIGKDGNPVVKYYSFTRLDPISGLLMAYTDAYEVADLVGEGKVDEALTHTAVSGARNITDRLFFEGINNLAKLIYEPQRAQRWLAQTVSSNVIASGLLRKAKNIPSDLYDMGLLNWTGVTEDQAYQWKLQEDINVYKGDEGLAIANRVNRGLTKVVPEWNRVTKLPPIREHITNKPKIKTQKPGFDFLTWFISSETDNHPVKTVFAKMGKGVSEPSDTITSFGGSVEGQSGMPIDAVELDVYKMSDLRYLINTIDSNGRLENERGYNGMTIDKAMQTYMQTDWFKSNYEIIKNEKKPWNTHPEVIEAILNGPPNGKFPGFREINSSYIARGKDRFLTLPENVDKLEEATKLKMQSRMKYVEMLQKANERIEY